MNIIRIIWRWFLRLIFLASILVLFFWVRATYLTNQHRISPQEEMSEMAEKIVPLENPKEITFQWRYGNKDYTLKETFYGSLYNFYFNSPKTYTYYEEELPPNWEEDYYAMFLKKNSNDDSISLLADDLRNLGLSEKLSSDQIVELTLAFVQSIPYDHIRAQEIIAGTGQTIYPYETLYQDTGVCSDKSFLLANLLDQMGYGTALLSFEDERHMAVGIGCPAEFSSYDSGYCYAETTSFGFRIGMIPDINSKEGSAIPMEKKTYSTSGLDQFDAKRLGEPKIFPVSGGKTYEGIADSLALAKKIDALNQEIDNLRKNLDAQKKDFTQDEKKLLEIEKKLKKLEKKKEYEEYNGLVEDYNDLLKKYKKKIKTYNEQIDLYNQKINSYNYLVSSF